MTAVDDPAEVTPRRGRDGSRNQDNSTVLATGEELSAALETIRRGVHHSPELREGLGATLLLAVVASSGQVVVPVAVQQTLDRGLDGPRVAPTSPTPCSSACSPRSPWASRPGRRTP